MIVKVSLEAAGIVSFVLAFVVVTCASAGWAGDSLPEFDAETITGDGLVALCANMDRPLAYAGGLNGCMLRATLCESHYGERVVRLSVDGYRKESPYQNGKLDVTVIEGLLSYEEK